MSARRELEHRRRVGLSTFSSGDRVKIDGQIAIVRQCFPEGSSSYFFPHCKVDFVGGDKNVAVNIARVRFA